jgi:heptosyltransferase-2
VVTAVTMALHIAIGLEKDVVLMNNIFNKHEFYLYGRGIVIEPDLNCKACYKRSFDAQCAHSNCMELIDAKQIYNAVELFGRCAQ